MQDKRGILALAVGLWVMALSGCVMGRGYYDRPVNVQKVGAIQRGVTTKKEILDWFGPPQEVDARDVLIMGTIGSPPAERLLGARYFRYRYWRSNLSMLFTGVFNYADVDFKSDHLVVFFNENDIVEDYAFAKDTDSLPRFGFLSR